MTDFKIKVPLTDNNIIVIYTFFIIQFLYWISALGLVLYSDSLSLFDWVKDPSPSMILTLILGSFMTGIRNWDPSIIWILIILYIMDTDLEIRKKRPELGFCEELSNFVPSNGEDVFAIMGRHKDPGPIQNNV